MTRVARTVDVLASIRAALRSDAQAVAGNNTLSKEEQASLTPGVLRDAASQLRATADPGARVTVDALVDRAVEDIETLFAAVNQSGGAGAATVSRDEVRALAARNPDAGQRMAKAYEVLTGRPLVLDGVTPTAAPSPDAGVRLGNLNEAHPRAVALVREYLSARSGGNDVFNAQERAALPRDFIRDAAYQAAPPRSVENITSHLFSQLLDPILTDCGVDMVQLGRLDGAGTQLVDLPFTDVQLARLLEVHPEAAGLFADAIAATTGQRPRLSGLPAARFVDATPPSPPAGAPDLTVVLAAVERSVETTLRGYDADHNGRLSAAEVGSRNDAVANAVRESSTPQTVAQLTERVMARLTESLAIAGLDTGSSNGGVHLTDADVTRLVESGAPAGEVALLLDGIEASGGSRPVLGDWLEVSAVLYDRVAQAARDAERDPNRNNILSAAERANLPDGPIRSAAEALRGLPVRPFAVASKVLELLRSAARAAGIPVDRELPNPRGISGYSAPVVYNRAQLERLIASDPGLAGLLADAHAMVYGNAQRPLLPGLPAPTVWP